MQMVHFSLDHPCTVSSSLVRVARDKIPPVLFLMAKARFGAHSGASVYVRVAQGYRCLGARFSIFCMHCCCWVIASTRSRFHFFVREQIIFSHSVTSCWCVHVDRACLSWALGSPLQLHLIIFEVPIVHTFASKSWHWCCSDILGGFYQFLTSQIILVHLLKFNRLARSCAFKDSATLVSKAL